MKRDILIFPKFKNIESINKIRNKYDRLASLVRPHITIVFPFTDDMPNDILICKVKEAIKDISPFKVKFGGIALGYDKYSKCNYIFLKCIEGANYITTLHDKIYKEALPSHLKTDEYIPHITLGQTDSIDFSFDETFECIIDEIIIEEIGKNEESIIIDKIKIG